MKMHFPNSPAAFCRESDVDLRDRDYPLFPWNTIVQKVHILWLAVQKSFFHYIPAKRKRQAETSALPAKNYRLNLVKLRIRS